MLYRDPYFVAARLAELHAEAASARLIRAASQEAGHARVPISLAERLDPRTVLARAAIRVSLASAATARWLDPCLAASATRRPKAFLR